MIDPAGSKSLMNIFYLDSNPKLAAKAHCDTHVNKMITESLQMMAAVCGRYNLTPPTKKNGDLYSVRSHPHHPATRWVGDSLDNFMWVYELALELCSEFLYRYKHSHAGQNSLTSVNLVRVAIELPDHGLTQPALCMPDHCKHPTADPVQSYRNFYNMEKSGLAFYANGRNPPSWWAPGKAANFLAGEVL